MLKKKPTNYFKIKFDVQILNSFIEPNQIPKIPNLEFYMFTFGVLEQRSNFLHHNYFLELQYKNEKEECVLVLNYWVNYDELCNFVRFLALRNLDVRI
ncbi:hypothetical protein J4230_04890 [Candidatus Woesearchaeota archaeon]|nr:hypothetical protein [Candidatus Woesearchaeota archaeon]